MQAEVSEPVCHARKEHICPARAQMRPLLSARPLQARCFSLPGVCSLQQPTGAVVVVSRARDRSPPAKGTLAQSLLPFVVHKTASRLVSALEEAGTTLSATPLAKNKGSPAGEQWVQKTLVGSNECLCTASCANCRTQGFCAVQASWLRFTTPRPLLPFPFSWCTSVLSLLVAKTSPFETNTNTTTCGRAKQKGCNSLGALVWESCGAAFLSPPCANAAGAGRGLVVCVFWCLLHCLRCAVQKEERHTILVVRAWPPPSRILMNRFCFLPAFSPHATKHARRGAGSGKQGGGDSRVPAPNVPNHFWRRLGEEQICSAVSVFQSALPDVGAGASTLITFFFAGFGLPWPKREDRNNKLCKKWEGSLFCEWRKTLCHRHLT